MNKATMEAPSNVNRKRKLSISTPTERKNQLVKNVQAMFHFISDIESVNGWFNVRSAIRNGFLKSIRAHAYRQMLLKVLQ